MNTVKKRDAQLMQREKFWFNPLREPTQTFYCWVVTVRERATECKFTADFYEQATREKPTFFCKEDSYKLIIYDEGVALSLEKAMRTKPLRDLLKRKVLGYVAKPNKNPSNS